MPKVSEEQLRVVNEERLKAQADREEAAASLAALEEAWRLELGRREVEAELAAAAAEAAKVAAMDWRRNRRRFM